MKPQTSGAALPLGGESLDPAAPPSTISASSIQQQQQLLGSGRSPKPWQLLAARVSADGLIPSDYSPILSDVFERTKGTLTSINMAEIIVLIGRLSAANHEQLDASCAMLLETVERVGPLPFEWDDVFASIPEIDGDLKVNSLECFALLVELHRRRYPDAPFPIEVGFSNRWSNRFSQALFVKWMVVAGTVSSSTTSYVHVPFLGYLRGVEISGDNALFDSFPPGFLSHSTSLMWSNGALLSVLLELVEVDHSAASLANSAIAGSESEELQAASGVGYELLKRPTINCPELLLATMVKSTNIVASVARPLAIDCLDNFWRRAQQKLTTGDVNSFLRWLATLNPARFSLVIIGALYTRAPEKIAEVVSALDPSLLPAILEGPPAPYKFHVAHLAWSPEFNAANWLKQRLVSDETGEVAKEFLLFLILSLCPLDVLQQKLPPGTSHPMRRLFIRPHELWLYLSVIVSNCAKPESIPALDYDQSVEQLLAKSRDLFDAELSKLKQACARLLPQLAGFILLVQPTRDTQTAPLSTDSLPSSVSPNVPSSGVDEPVDGEEGALQQEVHRYFAMLYTDEITSDDMLEIMKKFSRAPPNSHDYQVFNHMIKLLFHECRFFPKYPLSELAVTAQLMGRMIRDEILVGHGPHGTGHLLAIRCILEALRKGELTKMFRFGVTALQQFVDTRMVHCPDFLVALSTSLPDVCKHFPQYVEYAEKCLAVIPPELRRMHYIDRESLASLQLPSPPMIVSHPEFTLSPRRTNQSLGQTAFSPESQQLATDGLPPQRPLLINGKPISLGAFSLGSVERLLSSESQLMTGVVEPPQWFQDRVAQIFNSLVQSNLDPKSEDLRAAIQQEWFTWLALYMVKSRATKETNLHQLYVQFLERLGWSKLMDIVLSITYESINCLLSYVDAAKESSSYRTVLKNLGSWLGTITLSRNIPLRSKAIDLKTLLFDGYENGRLKALLPLCCKILEGVGQSRTLRPPNPWTVAIFSLLGEIHSLPGLITALVFEIEVLFKNLNLQVSDYKGRSNNLIKRPAPPANSPDFTKRPVPPSAPAQPPPIRPTSAHLQAGGNLNSTAAISNLISTLNGSTSQTPSYPLGSAAQRPPHPSDMLTAAAAKLSDPSIVMAARPTAQQPTAGVGTTTTATTGGQADNLADIQAALAADASLVRTFGPASHTTETAMKPRPTATSAVETTPTLLAGLMQSVVISPALMLFQLKPALKAVVPRAIERAIKEIVQIVAERSVTISCVATKELVCKDFAAEASESLIRRASHLMVASLSGSLALVTCREPLRAAMCQHLRTFLLGASEKLNEDQRLVDQVVGVVAADNMDLGCTLVEQSVIQRALQEIEITIQKPVLLRRQNKALGNATFLDPDYFNSNSRWPGALPDVLRPRAALTGDQLQVYKDFLTFGPLRRMQSSTAPPNLSAPPLSDVPSTAAPSTAVQAHPTVAPATEAAAGDGETTVLMRVEAALSQIKDIVHEVAFCYPVLSVKVTPDTRFCSPLGAIPECFDVPPCVNASLSILCRLPSCHEVFAAVLAVPACCGTARDLEMALLSVCQRVLKMINDAGALYRQHQLARGTDVAGLYLEVFLAILDQLSRLERFPRQQFESDLIAWLPQALIERRFGTDVVIGLLRYKLLSFSLADQTLVEQALASVEKRETVVFENVLKVLHRVATQTAIHGDDVVAALNELKGCHELTHRLPVTTDNTEPSSLSALLSRAVVALDNQPPQYFGDARQTVLDAINSALEGARTASESGQQAKPEMIVTFTQLLDDYATIGGPIVRVRKLPAPSVLQPERQQAFASLFDQWTVCALVVGSDRRSKVWAEFFQTLSKQRLLQMDEDTDRFFSGCVDRAIKLAQELPEPDSNQESSQPSIDVETPPELDCEGPNMKPIDALAKMIVAMMRLIDPSQISPVLILQRALSVIARSIHRDAEASPDSLPQKLYYRLLLSLIWEVGQPGRGLDTYAVPCLLYFASIYQVLNPCECPAFVFCWLELVSHKCFMPKMLRHLRGWPHYHRLLVCLLRFMYPFLNQVKLSSGVQALYKGVVRLLLVLLHDFPEFLCEYHVDLCENLPMNSVQMRNLILSAFPRNIKLPDPFMPNLKVDQLPESRRAPHLATHSVVLLLRNGIDKLLQNYWTTKNTEHLNAIIPKLKLSDEAAIRERGIHYNLSLINALLLHIVSHASQDQLPFTIGAAATVPLEEAPLEAKMLLYIAASLDSEGRYLLMSCLSNHLRYPNLHTHYFSCIMLWMFQEAEDHTAIQEQITRVLLERLIAHRPHPWGLLITFIELIKNPLFNFWNRPFVHSAPQVQKLFHSVAQTCLGQQEQPQLLLQLEQQHPTVS